MKTIKTKVHVEGIKVLDKAADVSARAKNAYVRTKETAEESKQSSHSSPTEYAADSSQNMVGTVATTAAVTLTKSPKKAHNNITRASNHFQEVRNQLPSERQHRAMEAQKNAVRTRDNAEKLKKTADKAKDISKNADKAVRDAKQNLKRVQSDGRQTLSEMRRKAMPRTKYTSTTGNTAGKSAKALKSTAKGQIKAAKKSVKTAERTARMTIKTAKNTAKTAHHTAKVAIKSAKAAEQAARVAAKTAIKAAKLAVKASIAIIKAIIAAVKGLVAAIAAGGWVAVVIIVVVCMIAILLGSVFGIFFSGQSNPDTGLTINSVIAEIDNEFTSEIDAIIIANPHDLLDMSGSRALWKHVLAVYTVRTVTDPDNPMEVATMNDEKAQILRTVFWDINTITHSLVNYEIELDVLDDEGLPTGETYIETTVVLYINIQGKTVSEISSLYGFNAEQMAWLEELLDPEYHVLWNTLLYGITSIGDGSLIAIAETQIGNIGGELYWRWYGFSSRVPWCAIFVSWVADQAGYLDAGIIPRFASTSAGVQWFRERGQWQNRGYTPAPGDLIFFDWNGDGTPQHVGIVERVEGNTVHTIEGNSSDSVRRRSYQLDSIRILGYGVPVY